VAVQIYRGTLIGVWAIIGVLSDAGSAFEAIKGAS
jgi:hypothetical protein